MSDRITTGRGSDRIWLAISEAGRNITHSHPITLPPRLPMHIPLALLACDVELGQGPGRRHRRRRPGAPASPFQPDRLPFFWTDMPLPDGGDCPPPFQADSPFLLGSTPFSSRRISSALFRTDRLPHPPGPKASPHPGRTVRLSVRPSLDGRAMQCMYAMQVRRAGSLRFLAVYIQ